MTFKKNQPFFFIIFSTLFSLALCFIWFLKTDFNTNDTIVSVIDSGVDLEHEELKNKLLTGIDLVDFDFKPNDTFGHGTHVTGIILKINPNVKILPVRIIDADNTLNTFKTPFAIFYSVIKGADVINMSFVQSKTLLTELSLVLAQKKGVILVASSGNDKAHSLRYPSSSEYVISVGGYDTHQNRFYPLSNFSTTLDLLAPSVYIKSLAVGGGEIMKSGTSMGSAYISGFITLFDSPKKQTKGEMVNTLRQFSRPFNHFNYKLYVADLKMYQSFREKRSFVHIQSATDFK